MEKRIILNNSVRELTTAECIAITGGGDITSYLRCMANSLTSGGGGLRTLALGVGVFGLGRVMGMAVGYACS